MLYIKYCGHHFSGLLINPTERIKYGELYLVGDKSVLLMQNLFNNINLSLFGFNALENTHI